MALQMILALSIIVAIHEFGHLITAKFFGMKVEKYFIGFPPKIWGFVGLIPVITGILGWCPLYLPFKINTNK